MDTTTSGSDLGWAPSACTLPTTEQPLRLAEFDDLFAGHVVEVRRDDATHLRLALTHEPAVAATAADLAARETQCCGFFTFELHITDSGLALGVSTGPAHADVLAALADRATALAGLPPAVVELAKIGDQAATGILG